MKKFYCSFVVFATLLFVNFSALATCGESGSGGALKPGRVATSSDMKKFIGYLIQVTRQDGGNTELYKVQENDGYYLKICNEEEHKKHFRKVFHLQGSFENCQYFCDVLSRDVDGVFVYKVSTTDCPSGCSTSCYRECEVH